jgi:membrane protein required for colicin V production
MIWIDFAMIGLVIISSIIGLFRGLVREAFALIIWGLAIWVGLSFGRGFSVFLENMIAIPSARLAAGFALLFFMTLILGSIVSYLLGEIITKTGLTGTDRFLGMIFGIGRGVLVVSIIVVLAGLTPLPDEPWWQESKLIPPFQSVAVWLRSQVPDSLAGHINYQQ